MPKPTALIVAMPAEITERGLRLAEYDAAA